MHNPRFLGPALLLTAAAVGWSVIGHDEIAVVVGALAIMCVVLMFTE